MYKSIIPRRMDTYIKKSRLLFFTENVSSDLSRTGGSHILKFINFSNGIAEVRHLDHERYLEELHCWQKLNIRHYYHHHH